MKTVHNDGKEVDPGESSSSAAHPTVPRGTARSIRREEEIDECFLFGILGNVPGGAAEIAPL